MTDPTTGILVGLVASAAASGVAILMLFDKAAHLKWEAEYERARRRESDQLASEAYRAAAEAKATAEDAHRVVRNLIEKGGQECSRCS